MGKHRRDDTDPGMPETVLIPKVSEPETVLIPKVKDLVVIARAEPEPAPRRRIPRYAIPAGAGTLLLLLCSVWVLTRPGDPVEMIDPETANTTSRTYQVIEGFGQPSPSASLSPSPGGSTSASPSARPSPSVAPTQTPGDTGPPPPLAHYRFDETSGTAASDASGHGRTATLSGGASFVSGRLGNCADLSGSSQYVALPSGILSGATDFTVSTWVRLDSIGNWTRVFDFGRSTSVNMFLTARTGSGTARFAITTGGNSSEQRINAPSALPTGAWTHVAITLSNGVGILYVNRSEVARTTGITLTPSSLGSTTNNYIGRSQYSADPYLNGTIDDFRVYARALSASEIAALP